MSNQDTSLRTRILLVTLLWAICGLTAAGFYNNYVKNAIGRPAYWTHSRLRDNLGSTVGLGLVGGPFALLLSPFFTGFYQYGWSLSISAPQEKPND